MSSRVVTRMPWVLCCALAGTLIASCQSTQPIQLDGDYEVFESVEALIPASDLVVVGTIGDVALRQVSEFSDLPHVYHELLVTETIHGQAKNGTTLIVAILDSDKVIFENGTSFDRGQKVLLFLDEVFASEGPAGAVPFDVIYVPLSGSNGVMDLSADDIATSRSLHLVALKAEDVEAGRADEESSLSVGLANLRAQVADIP